MVAQTYLSSQQPCVPTTLRQPASLRPTLTRSSIKQHREQVSSHSRRSSNNIQTFGPQQHLQSSRPSLCVHARKRPDGSYKDWIGAEASQDEPQEQQEFQQEFVDAPTSGSMETSKISSNVRERVEQAMETLSCRATVGDVAGAAGLQVDQAEAALNALAADTLGTLQVSSSQPCSVVHADIHKVQLSSWCCSHATHEIQGMSEPKASVGHQSCRKACIIFEIMCSNAVRGTFPALAFCWFYCGVHCDLTCPQKASTA